MKKILLILYLITGVMVVSCTDMMPVRQDVNEVGMSVGPLVFDDINFKLTKSQFDFDGSNFTFKWNATDTVGIFPNAGSQAFFSMSSFAGSSEAKFEGGGWALKGDGAHSYAAYAPFKFENKNLQKVPFDYRHQHFDGNDVFGNVANYQFLGAVLQTPADGVLNYMFKRLECFVWFQFKLPENYVKEFESFTFKISDGTPIVVSTFVDFTKEEVEVSPDDTQTSYTIPLNGVDNLDGGDTIDIYMMLPPQDFTGKKILVAVKSIDGDTCRAEIDGKNNRMDKGRQYTATLTSDFGSLVEGFEGKNGQW